MEESTKDNTIIDHAYGIECQICGGNVPIPPYRYNLSVFPVCDQCKVDLKEYVLSKRVKK